MFLSRNINTNLHLNIIYSTNVRLYLSIHMFKIMKMLSNTKSEFLLSICFNLIRHDQICTTYSVARFVTCIFMCLY